MRESPPGNGRKAIVAGVARWVIRTESICAFSTTSETGVTTHTISYFKNHALSLLDEVAAKGESLLITRRDKPLARVEPVRTAQGVELGKLSGTMEINEDIVAPLGPND